MAPCLRPLLLAVSLLCGAHGVPRNGRPDDTWYDCTGLDDGLYIGDCRTFYRCANESTRMLPCPGSLVVNEKHMWCDYARLVAPPCGTAPNCSNIIDGRYPDLGSRCTQFFTCQHDDFYGFTKCAASLVFNEEKDSCDWPFLVKPPCGTAGGHVWPEGEDSEAEEEEVEAGSWEDDVQDRKRRQRAESQRVDSVHFERQPHRNDNSGDRGQGERVQGERVQGERVRSSRDETRDESLQQAERRQPPRADKSPGRRRPRERNPPPPGESSANTRRQGGTTQDSRQGGRTQDSRQGGRTQDSKNDKPGRKKSRSPFSPPRSLHGYN